MSFSTPKITLEQWAAFKTVVDAGSFSLAAEQLNKSQSTVSYAVARVNALLPCPVLTLSGRKATLTAEGEVMHRHATQLLEQARQTEAVARSLAMQFEAEVTLAMDALLDVGAVLSSLEEFSRAFPHTRVRVLETSLSGTVETIIEKRADVAITASVPVGFLGTPLRQIDMIPVAAPSHPLIQAGRVIQESELRAHRQVALRDTGYRREQDSGWLQAEQRWTMSHFSSSIKIVKAGLAFAFLPRNWIVEELERGELKPIPVKNKLSRRIGLHLVLPAGEASGPASSRLAEHLIADLA